MGSSYRLNPAISTTDKISDILSKLASVFTDTAVMLHERGHTTAMVSFVNINGARLAYRISDIDATKPLFITLHGGRGFGKNKKHLH